LELPEEWCLELFELELLPAELPPEPVTTTVAFIVVGWGVQWYEKVPAFVNL
jgi:hypothetical protein